MAPADAAGGELVGLASSVFRGTRFAASVADDGDFADEIPAPAAPLSTGAEPARAIAFGVPQDGGTTNRRADSCSALCSATARWARSSARRRRRVTRA